MRNKIVLYAIKFFLYFYNLTINFKLIGNIEQYKKPYKNIFTFWHGTMFPLIFLFRNKKIDILVSMSKDGEIIANIIHTFGYTTTRGSTSKGGDKALLELLKKAKKNINAFAFTPDGPRGPIYSIHPGVIYFAMKSKLPIVHLSVSCTRYISLKSWDRFMIPLPFSTVIVKVSHFYYVNPKKSIKENIKNYEKFLSNSYIYNI